MHRLTSVLVLMAASCFAQRQMPDPAPHQAAMKRVQFLTGKWEGNGWIQMGTQKHTFKQSENIRLKLSDTVLLIEGLGQKKESRLIRRWLSFPGTNEPGRPAGHPARAG